jgi:hypothetical protein
MSVLPESHVHQRSSSRPYASIYLCTHTAIDAIIYTERQLLTLSGGWPIESLQQCDRTA